MVKYHPSSNTLISTEQRGEVHNKYCYHHSLYAGMKFEASALWEFSKSFLLACLQAEHLLIEIGLTDEAGKISRGIHTCVGVDVHLYYRTTLRGMFVKKEFIVIVGRLMFRLQCLRTLNYFRAFSLIAVSP